MSDFINLSAVELAKGIRNQKFSSVEVVSEHIKIIRAINPKINAITEERFTQALAEAHAADEKAFSLKKVDPESSERLLGVPFTIKEMFSVKGMRSTLGSSQRKNRVMLQSSTTHNRLTNQGAILLGTTNVPEIGFWFECYNPIYGRTSNPYDFSRTSGGSSGGEGAIIGAGGSPFGVGSDIGGSIRMPAAFCGIYGHKSSSKIIPLTGHPPFDGNQDDLSIFAGKGYPLTVVGPMTRKASDLEMLFDVLSGSDGLDPETKIENVSKKFSSFNLKNLKVYLLPDPIIHATTRTAKEIQNSVRQLGQALKDEGAQIFDFPEKLFIKAAQIWSARLTLMQGRDFQKNLSPERAVDYRAEFLKLGYGQSEFTLPALAAGILDNLFKANPSKQDEANKILLFELESIKRQMNQLLGDNGILLMPTHPRLAPKHNSPLLRPFDFAYTAIINALELPATALPMGLHQSLPLSVQVISSSGNDYLNFKIAEFSEKQFGGWKRPNLK